MWRQNTSCVLAPELTAGPYYVVGEYMRSNIKEAEHSDGVDIFLEVQYVDVSTCGAVPNVAVDVWNCNATGVYSGVSESSGQAGIDTTFLRGIQLTDHDGVVQFETIFPGHYSGRAIHTHLLSHMNATVQSNGTISVWNKAVSHIGQLFWPEDLRQEIEALEPYASNTVAVTTNDEDMWYVSYPLPRHAFPHHRDPTNRTSTDKLPGLLFLRTSPSTPSRNSFTSATMSLMAFSPGSRSASTPQPTTRTMTTMVSWATSMLTVATPSRAVLESAVVALVLLAAAVLLVPCLQVLRPLVLLLLLDPVQIFLVDIEGCSVYIPIHIYVGGDIISLHNLHRSKIPLVLKLLRPFYDSYIYALRLTCACLKKCGPRLSERGYQSSDTLEGWLFIA